MLLRKPPVRKKSVEIQIAIQSQISQFYSVISQERENRIKTRNWAVTIWLAYLALLGSGRYYTDKATAAVILGIIIIIFWCIEAFHQSLVLVNENRVRKLEFLLASKELPKEIPHNFFYISGYPTITKGEKIKAFLLACFTSEPILFFHLAMILGSACFIFSVELTPLIIQPATK